jgi:hypothetical protein
MVQGHFLLQDWLQWAQATFGFLHSGGWQALRDSSGNYDPGRDAGNAATGAGGAALTADAFRQLTGFNTPPTEAPDGFHRTRDVFGRWLDDLLGGGADHGGETPAPQHGPPSGPPYPTPFDDLLGVEPGGQQPPPADVRLEDLLPDDLK